MLRLENTAIAYGLVARLLHWTSVVMLVVAVYLSSEIGAAPAGAARTALIEQHAGFGLALLLIMFCRFWWRQRNLNPILSYTIHAGQKRAAISVHWMIYAVIIAQCLVGLVQLLYSDNAVSVAGVDLSGLRPPPETALSERMGAVHVAFSNLIYIVLAVHITAAIYHQIFGVRDEASASER